MPEGFSAAKARLRRAPAPRHLRAFTTRFKGKLYLLVVNRSAGEDESECEAFKLARQSKATGTFWRSGTTKVQVWGLSNGGGRNAALTWLDQRRRIVHARLVGCGVGVKVRRARLFAERDTLKVICKKSIGSDYEASADYYHAFAAGPPRRILSASLGLGFVVTRKNKSCTQLAGGWVKVLTVGSVPKVRIATPKPENSATKGSAADWTYQPKKKSFRRISAPKLMSFRPVVRCPT